MPHEEVPAPVAFPALSPGPITPTDISQFIRLEQCERYLRLRLHERAHGRAFMYDYDAAPQSIPPLLTRSGMEFEDTIERGVRARFEVLNVGTDIARQGRREDDNELVVTHIRDLAAGGTLVLFQPRLDVAIDGWRIRGDIDILRLERDAEGALRVLIVDMKSSTNPKIEHRLQVAFYHHMLSTLLAEHEIGCAELRIGILYRGPAGTTASLTPDGAVDVGSAAFQAGSSVTLSAAEAAERAARRQAAIDEFGAESGFLEVVADPDTYLRSVRDLVTGQDSTAARAGKTPFDALNFHLTYKCDGCLYNEFCLKRCAQRDDLSVLPYLSAQDKGALRRNGIATTRALAALKLLPMASPGSAPSSVLAPAIGAADVLRTLAVTWPVGPRLDELIIRAQRYRAWKGDGTPYLSYIPSKGYGSLPYADSVQNPNLVRIYIDAQHDYLRDRVYMLGALLVGCEGGEPRPERRRSVVRVAERSPDTAETERNLFVNWVRDLLTALLEVAAPDLDGNLSAPIHLIFFNHFDQQVLLDGLSRHASEIIGATALYDFITQIASFDSALVTFLDEELRELKNYPMLCQSLQAVAAFLKFDWNSPHPYRQIFRVRLFDFWRKLDGTEDGEIPWYTGRSRFNSQIPLEYAYAAWNDLPEPPARGHDSFAAYRDVTMPMLEGFHARRLEAMEHITGDFKGNKQTLKTSFDLSAIAGFDGRARTLAHALDEFVTIERHVELAAWKTARLAPPERRALAGDTLLGAYHDADQDTDVAAVNGENKRKHARAEQLKAEGVALGKAEKKELKWSQEGLRIRLRLQAPPDCSLEQMLGLTTLRAGSGVVVRKRWEVDSRLPAAEQIQFTPTPKQLLYGSRGTIVSISGARERVACVEIEMRSSFGGKGMRGFVFGGRDEPFEDDTSYTLDEDPNSWYGYWGAKVTEALAAGNGGNTLYDRLLDMAGAVVAWPEAAAADQKRFLAGLDAFQHAGAMHGFEAGKRDYIGGHGDAAALLVQGPPGTGKSYTTAYALLARLQGALAADLEFRVFVTCKTHAATGVLLDKIVEEQGTLRKLQASHPEIFAAFIDARLLDIPLFRAEPRGEVPDGVRPLFKRREDRQPGNLAPVDQILGERHCIVATTPGGTYGMVKEAYDDLLGNALCDCLVLDEASQMNLPEAAMAALLLKPGGQLIVVGDHRQMPPIVKHEWSTERRRTFQRYRAYESLFTALLPLATATIKFEESFRLHRDMAAFLRQEIYRHDGIAYFSRQHRLLQPLAHDDPFVAGVLSREHTVIVVVHEECDSQLRNPYEQALITPLLDALAGPYHLDPRHGLGVVVPHRAQRAALQEDIPAIVVRDPDTQAIAFSAVDTVERFQGDERDVILVSATESDREYLLLNGDFLLDPRRLTVAMSRARHKMVLVASRSVFSLFSTDEETFMHAQLWKNLLRHTCTALLWEGEREGKRVEVWGNVPSAQLQ